MSMLEIVEEMCGKNNSERRNIVEKHILQEGLPYQPQAYGLNDNLNLVMDFQPGPSKKLFLTAHYDCIPNSPGANDNASSVAVLLELAKKFHKSQSNYPLTIIIFDQEEERLRGSQAYVKERGVADIGAVLNLEMVGSGTVPVFWERFGQSKSYLDLLQVASHPQTAHFLSSIPGHAGDHFSFLLEGITNSICLSLADERDLPLIKIFEGGLIGKMGSLMRGKLMSRLRTSYTFRDYHTPTDDITKINPVSLQIAYDIVERTVQAYSRELRR
jgi:hypothetical protein